VAPHHGKLASKYGSGLSPRGGSPLKEAADFLGLPRRAAAGSMLRIVKDPSINQRVPPTAAATCDFVARSMTSI
jgi:hypothetical protein